jgi:hypothetical protein
MLLIQGKCRSLRAERLPNRSGWSGLSQGAFVQKGTCGLILATLPVQQFTLDRYCMGSRRSVMSIRKINPAGAW